MAGQQQDNAQQDVSPIDVYQSLINGLQPQVQQAAGPDQPITGMDQGGVQPMQQTSRHPLMKSILTGALMGLASGAGHLSPEADPSGAGQAFASGFGNSMQQRQQQVDQQNKALLASREENRTQGKFEQGVINDRMANIQTKLGLAKAFFESEYLPEAEKAAANKPLMDMTEKMIEPNKDLEGDSFAHVTEKFGDWDSMQQALMDANRAGRDEYPGILPDGTYVLMELNKSKYSGDDIANVTDALGLTNPDQSKALRNDKTTYGRAEFGKIMSAAAQKFANTNTQLHADYRARVAANAKVLAAQLAQKAHMYAADKRVIADPVLRAKVQRVNNLSNVVARMSQAAAVNPLLHNVLGFDDSLQQNLQELQQEEREIDAALPELKQPTPGNEKNAGSESHVLTVQIARQYLQKAKGDKALAKKLAAKDGYK